MTLTDQVQAILQQHHEPAKQAMPAVTQALSAAPMPLRQDWAALRMLLTDHLGKEEILLFPAIEALERGDRSAVAHILGPIAQMHVEHGQLDALDQRLRAQLDQAGAARPALEAFLDDLVVHAGKEDDALFPGALALALEIPVDEVDLDALVGGVVGRGGEDVVSRPRVAARPAPAAAPPRRRSLLRRVVKRVLDG